MKHTSLISVPGLKFATTPSRRLMIRDNTLDIFNAEIWAREALLELEGNLVLGHLAYRDFSNEVSTFGSVVNVARPGSFNARRKKALCESIKIQDGSADSFQVELNQFLYTSFKICDGEENRGMNDLVRTMLNPAVQSLVQKVDLVLAGQHVNFWDQSAGKLQGLDGTNVNDFLVDLVEVMNTAKVPQAGRQISVTPRTHAMMLREKLFTAANTSGNTDALRRANVGQLYGFDFYMANSQPQISPTGLTQHTMAVNNAAGYSAGATVLTVDTVAGGAFAPGEWVVIAGDQIPQRLIAASATSITIAPGLKRAVADNAVITGILSGAAAGSYSGPTTNPRRIGYSGYLLTDGWGATVPQAGQPVSFGIQSQIYTIIEVSSEDDSGVALAGGSFNLLLDRPLEVTVADNALVNLGPAGSYNFAFTENALAAAFRPLPKPRTGALSSVINDNNLSIRVTITYDGVQQAHIVTVDLLMGVAVYDPNVAAVLFG